MTHHGAVAILTYHSLDNSSSVLSTAPLLFAKHMHLLYEQQVSVLSLSEVGQLTREAVLPPFSVVITFDDGFESVYEYAMPVLLQYGFPATIFLVTDYCNKTNAWPSQPQHVTRRPLLSWSAIKEMSGAGVTFGSHTRTHPDLRHVSKHQEIEEIVGSKKALEDVIGRSVETFAYPYGVWRKSTKQLVQEHFRLACTTTPNFVTAASDSFALERLDMYYLRHPVFLRRLFSLEMRMYLALRRMGRTIRHHVSVWGSNHSP